MNRLLFLVMLLTAAFESLGQVVGLTRKDTAQFETKIRSYSNSELVTTAGKVRMSDIKAIAFSSYQASSESLYEACRNNGIQVTYDYKVGSAKAVMKSPLLVGSQDYGNIDIESYRIQTKTGKLLELSGLGIACLAAVLSSNSKSSSSGSGLAIAGGVVMTTGFIIELDALKHLKKQK